jgi:hypothetical protein
MYTLLDYKEMKKIKILDEEVLQIINKISSMVGVQYNIPTLRAEKKYTVPQQVTTLLNKLTEDNYIHIQNTILDLIKNNENEIKEVSVIIFEIILKNAFYGELYAKLFLSLNEWSIFTETLNQKMDNHITNIQNVKNISSDDYDEYCINNEINDQYKTFSQFIVYLTLNNGIDINKLNTLINHLIDLLHTIKDNHVLIELVEHLYILISKSKSIHSKLNIPRNKLKLNNVPNKILFRLMDILDII